MSHRTDFFHFYKKLINFKYFYGDNRKKKMAQKCGENL
jgi:hypothetical protein